MAPPAAVRRGTSPIVWILVIVAGLFVLGGLAVVGTTMFFFHKARQAGLDPALIQSKPGLAVAKMIAAANPDVEVLSTNDGAGTITLRDKNTGKVTTMSFDDARNGKFSISAQDENGKTATMQFGGPESNLPSWVPAYPGSHPQVAFTGNGDGGASGMFTFSTADPLSKVMQFYEEKIKEAGMKTTTVLASEQGSVINGSDDNTHRTLNVTAGAGSGGTTVSVTYGSK